MWSQMNSDHMHTSNQYTLGPSLRNWFGCGLLGGFRLSEWAQDTNVDLSSAPLLDDSGVPKAFCLPGVDFRLDNNKRVSMREALRLPPAAIHRSLITFTHQKNGNNGETRVFVQNKQNPTLCFVTLMLRIVQQFDHLAGWEATSTPLAIYQSSTGTVCFITANDINCTMRATAAAVYGLNQAKHAREL
jgi:hypothetical protein